MKGKREPVEVRFWRFVGPMEVGKCWLWRGAKAGLMGYGSTSLNRVHIPAHRLMWQMKHGPIPTGMRVLHECDTPACVNPGHLFLGTQGDNMRDMVAKGRHARYRNLGSAHGCAKLDEAKVLEMRKFLDEGVPQALLAKRYDVHQTLVSLIKCRKAWRHI